MFRRATIFFFIISCFAVSAQDSFFTEPVLTKNNKVRELQDHEYRIRRVGFDSQALLNTIKSFEIVDLPLFDDTWFQVKTTVFKDHGDGLYTWHGDIEAETYGKALITFGNGQLSGHIQIDDQIFAIDATRGPNFEITQVAPNTPIQCGNMASEKEDRGAWRRKTSTPSKPTNALKADSGSHHLKVLVLLDPAYCSQASSLRSQYEEALNDNFALMAPWPGTQYDQVSATVVTECFNDWDYTGDMGTDRDNMILDPDVEAVRYAHQADLVTFIANNNDYGTQTGIAKISGYHSIVKKNMALSYYTLAHEIGHNLGMLHNREDAYTSGASAGLSSTECKFGKGYNNGPCTTMTYSSTYGSSAYRVPIYSHHSPMYGQACNGTNLSYDNHSRMDEKAENHKSYYAADYLINNPGLFMAVGNTSSYGDTFDLSGTDGDDVAYLLDLDQSGQVYVDNLLGAMHPNTRIAIYDESGNLEAQAIGSSPINTSLSSGLYYVVVDSVSPDLFHLRLRTIY